MFRNKLIPLCAIAALSGCADTVYVTAQHESHITQHAPIAEHPTHYGRDTIGLEADWRIGEYAILSAQDSYALYGSDGNRKAPREVFQLTVKYEVWHK